MIVLWIIFSVVLIFALASLVGAPYVPTLKKDLATAFDDMYTITAKDVVVDIGSGDGIVLREVARRGGRAIGYEINPLLVMISILSAWSNSHITVRLANIWGTNLPDDTTLVYAFSVTRDMPRIALKLQAEATRLNRPLYFMSYGAHIKGVKPTKQVGAHHLYTFTPLQGEKAQV